MRNGRHAFPSLVVIPGRGSDTPPPAFKYPQAPQTNAVADKVVGVGPLDVVATRAAHRIVCRQSAIKRPDRTVARIEVVKWSRAVQWRDAQSSSAGI
jgi:hypothetical protein